MISSLIASSPLFLAFGIPSGPDLIVLLIIVLVLFGAKRLPEIARSLGQSVHEFKKAKQEFEEAAHAKPSSAPTVSTPPTPSITVVSAPQEEPKSSQQS
jgi:sec-independent protein translocase protein TatA